MVDQALIDDLQAKLSQAVTILRVADQQATAGRLALEVMHDIRNPLEALRNLNYLTVLSAENPDEVRTYGRLAEEQMTIVIGIANTVLGFSQAANEPRPVNLVPLTEAAVRIHQRTIDTKKVRLLMELEQEVERRFTPARCCK